MTAKTQHLLWPTLKLFRGTCFSSNSHHLMRYTKRHTGKSCLISTRLTACNQVNSGTDGSKSLTALSYCTTSCQITVLSVHVVCTTTRVVSQPNTKVLYCQRLLLVHLIYCHTSRQYGRMVRYTKSLTSTIQNTVQYRRCTLRKISVYRSYRWIFASVIWHCLLGDRKVIQPLKSWVLVCWWRQLNGSVKEPNIDIFLFSAHYSMVFYFWCSVYWWKGSVRF